MQIHLSVHIELKHNRQCCTPQTNAHISQVTIVFCIGDVLSMYLAAELKQFKFRFRNKSKSFKTSAPISPLFSLRLSRFGEKGIEVWVWVSSVIIQCFSYSRLLYNSRCCLIPFGRGHICYISKFMTTFRVVYSVKALFAAQRNALFCLIMQKHI